MIVSEISTTNSSTHPLLERSELCGRQSVRLADHWDDVDSGRKSSHQLNVHLPESTAQSARIQIAHCLHLRVTGRRDEVEQRVNSVIPEPRISLDSRLFSENVVVLSFEIARDFLEAAVVSEGGHAGLDR